MGDDIMKNNNHNNQKKIAAINDISGFGRCSTTVSMPIISYMKIQYCPVITSIFSNHTAYEDYFFDDYTDKIEEYVSKWKKLNLEFEGIYTGFLGSIKQIGIVKQFISEFKTLRTQVIIDPVMGDDGIVYATYTKEMCEGMKELVAMADIVTPNITESCILTGKQYKQEKWTKAELIEMADIISATGPSKVVITGVRFGDSYIGNLAYEKGKKPVIIRSKLAGAQRCGTGDVFSSIICADAVNGVDFAVSVKKASEFVKKCVKISIERNIPKEDGVCFEELLHTLRI